MLVTEAKFELPNARSVVARVCEHLTDHAATLSRSGEKYIVAFAYGTGTLELGDGGLSLRAEAADISSLHAVRVALAAHIVEFAGAAKPRIVWTGDGTELKTPPNFRILDVAAVIPLSPHMRRVWFKGEDLARVTTDDNLHVTLIFPPPGVAEPEWPTMGSDGLLSWPDGERKPSCRKYTIRMHDVAAGAIAIDFVDHDDAGPGCAWAAQATPGQQIGMTGPGGLGIRPADWYLLAGDETALPAIGRILKSLPATARGVALIEVADADEEQTIEFKARIDVRWLHRQGAAPGSTTLLADAVRDAEFPQDGASVFAWAGTEFEAFRAIRANLRNVRGLAKHQHLVVSYWRKGQSEDE